MADIRLITYNRSMLFWLFVQHTDIKNSGSVGFVRPHDVLKVESTEETEGRKPISFVVPGIHPDVKHTPKKTGPIVERC